MAVDLYVWPERNSRDPEGYLVWRGTVNFPYSGALLEAADLPTLVSNWEQQAARVLPLERLDLHIFLVPHGLHPKEVMEIRLLNARSWDRTGLGNPQTE